MSASVSVIITAYNSEKYISDALASISNQEFQDFELIVIDDGSTTKSTKEICRDFEESEGIPVRYICQANGGPSRARNAGLSLAQGEFVSFLDADDIFVPSKLSRQFNMLRNLPNDYASVVGCSLKFHDRGLKKNEKICPDILDGHFDINSFLSGNLLIEGTPGYYLFRRTALISVGGFDESLRNNEDFDILLRLNRSFKIKTHQDIVFMQRIRPDSLSKVDPIAGLHGVLKFANKVLDAMPDVSRAAVARKKQRAYFSAALSCLKKRQIRHYLWLANKGLDLGRVKTWRGIFVLIATRPLRWLAKKPSGI